MSSQRRVLAALACALVLAASACQTGPAFRHDVAAREKPWTHESFANDPDDFQFVVTSDRTGGMRDGVFAAAVDQVNLLRPELVVCIGDLIPGGTTDEAVLNAERAEFDALAGRLEAPFFRLPGNHDISNPFMSADWDVRYGARYYSFVYKNVLFLCMNTMDMKPGTQQVDWAIQTVAANPDVRWTCVLMHHPLWLNNERAERQAEALGEEPAYNGFEKIEAALADRPYTVFAGHYHTHTQYTRHGRNYYRLATTGGGGGDQNSIETGHFDQVAWVTMTDDGPRMAVLKLDGILPHDVLSEDLLRFRGSLAFSEAVGDPTKDGVRFVLALDNASEADAKLRLAWDAPADGPWQVEPATAELTIAPGKAGRVEFLARLADANEAMPLPTCRIEYDAAAYKGEVTRPAPVGLDALLRSNRPTTTARRAAVAPVLDGKLDDAVWQAPADATDFRNSKPKLGVAVRTQAWLAWDDVNLYVAFRCEDPDALRAKIDATRPDDVSVWEDDAIEFMVDTDLDRGTYWHFMVNAAGVLYDALGQKGKFDTGAQAAAVRARDAWTVEVVVPWAGMKVAPPVADRRMGLLLSRDYQVKTGPDGATTASHGYQFPLLNGWNHRVENFGDLLLAK